MRAMSFLKEGRYNYGQLVIFLAIVALYGCSQSYSKGNLRHEPSLISKERGTSLVHTPITVFPLRNSTGELELNWISTGLQDSLTTDLYYVSELHTKSLLNFSQITKEHSHEATLSCVTGLNAGATSDCSLTLSDWQTIAMDAKLGQFLWGEYHLQEDDIKVSLRLYGGGKWTLQDEITIKAPLAKLLQESSKQILSFIKHQGITVKSEEVERILSTKTASVTAWKQNAMGYWWRQKYFMSEEEQKKTLAEKCEASLGKAVAIDPHYAEAWCNLGYQRIITGDLDGAIEAFQKALACKPNLVNAHMGLGYCLAEKGDPVNALSPLEQVVRLNPSLSDYYSYLMSIYQNAKLWQKGLNTLETLEHFLRERDREAERMDVVWWRAMFLQELRDFAESEKAYQEVLFFKEKNLGTEHPEVAAILNDIALLNKSRGEYSKAKSLYERALTIDEKFYGYEHSDVAKDLSNLAGLHFAQGEYDKAKLLYERALAIDDEICEGTHPDIAKDLNNLAELYRVLGKYDKAKPLYERALTVGESVHGPNHPSVALLLNNLAELYCDVGEYDQARPLYERALSIYKNAHGSKHPDVATVLNNLAGLYYISNDYDKAKTSYEGALEIDEESFGLYHPQVSIRLNNLAEIYYAMGKYDKAKPLYERALVIAHTSGQPELLWRVQFNIAYLLAKQENPHAAILLGKQAVNIIQKLRVGISNMEIELQKSFLKTKWHVYKFLADLLIDQGRIPEAQQLMSMQKEEEFFDFLCRNAGKRDVRTTTATYTDEEQLWVERYQEINTRVAALGREFTALRQKKKLGLTDDEEKRYQQLDNDLKISKRAFHSYLTKLRDDLDGIGKEPAKVKELSMLVQLKQALRELGHGAVVIHYLITDDKLHIILTTPEVIQARDVAISSKELSRKIMDFRITLHNPRRSPLSYAQELYQIVLAPVAEDLRQAGAKTLMLSLDGALHYLPVAALHDGECYVAERYLLTIYNTEAKLVIKDRPTGGWQVGGLGLSKAVLNLDPLPNVPAELEGIVRRGPLDQDGVLPGVIYLDELFTQEAIESVLSEEYPVMHIASHFELTPGTIQNSHLVLGNGTTLTLAKIREYGYDFGSIEMLTLSACNTAVGGTEADGSEVESFANLAQMHGAKGVLATLWPVLDQSTGIFMKNFYRVHKEQPDITKVEALHQAQLLFIHGEIRTEEKQSRSERVENLRLSQQETSEGEESFTPNPNTPYAHPYYWSPFILMGNWL